MFQGEYNILIINIYYKYIFILNKYINQDMCNKLHCDLDSYKFLLFL